MTDLVEVLDWDSCFFGFAIGRVLAIRLDESGIAALLSQARARGLRCLYFQADPNDAVSIRLAERHGFHLVDVRIVLEHPFSDRPAPVPRYPVSPLIEIGAPRAAEAPALEDIAVEIGHTSRFCFDLDFPRDACPRLYRAWLARALQDEAGVVLVARMSDQPVGLIACNRLDDDTGVIDLAGVREGMRGRGVGTALVQAALDWFRRQGMSRAEVVTQARNVPAQRLYQQMGFFTRRMTLYYHKWLDRD